jgi:hypothetical protein
LKTAAENSRILLFENTYGLLTDWASQGCPFARLLYASLPEQLSRDDNLKISIGIPNDLEGEGIEILELYEDSLGLEMYAGKDWIIRLAAFTSGSRSSDTTGYLRVADIVQAILRRRTCMACPSLETRFPPATWHLWPQHWTLVSKHIQVALSV